MKKCPVCGSKTTDFQDSLSCSNAQCSNFLGITNIKLTKASLSPQLKMPFFDVDGYEELAETLIDAYNQAARGKGRERHNPNNIPFVDQPIMNEIRELGPSALAFQVRKKTRESMNLNYKMAQKEMLGAIVYAAAMYIYYQEKESE